MDAQDIHSYDTLCLIIHLMASEAIFIEPKLE